MKILIKAEEEDFPGGLFSEQRWSFISLEERNRSEAMLELVFTRLARRVRMIYSRRRLRDAPDFHSFSSYIFPRTESPSSNQLKISTPSPLLLYPEFKSLLNGYNDDAKGRLPNRFSKTGRETTK